MPYDGLPFLRRHFARVGHIYLVVEPAAAEAVCAAAQALGEKAYIIGRTTAGEGVTLK